LLLKALIRLIMILKELNTYLSLHEIFEIFLEYEHCFLLESGGDIKKLARYSIIGGAPFLTFKSKGEDIEIRDKGGIVRKRGNPFEELKSVFNRFRVKEKNMAEIPFAGGAVGYFGYDLAGFLETLPAISTDDLNLPDSYFMFVNAGIIYDQWSKKKYIFSIDLSFQYPEWSEKTASDFVAVIEKKVRDKEKNKCSEKDLLNSDIRGRVTNVVSKRKYIDMIEKAKEYIRIGDVYEVNLSHRMEIESGIEPWQIYRRINSVNPTPFAAYLQFGDLKIISASPERFLKIEDSKLESRPIKGTRRRGETPQEDENLKNDLISSEKEKAENLMIVDLVRNDFGRVCRFGTVGVKELMAVEAYSGVFQMVSTIEGEISEDKDMFDCIKACFPGGSMTGAPKIRAMEIIEELETVKRGIYSGSLGYLSFSGEADLNIIIRTLIAAKEKLYLQVGGAIVADSEPEKEYEETWQKAMPVLEAVGWDGKFWL